LTTGCCPRHQGLSSFHLSQRYKSSYQDGPFKAAVAGIFGSEMSPSEVKEFGERYNLIPLSIKITLASYGDFELSSEI